jgi:hypothetical protein
LTLFGRNPTRKAARASCPHTWKARKDPSPRPSIPPAGQAGAPALAGAVCFNPRAGARGGAGGPGAVGARARPGGFSSGQAQQARKGQDCQRRGDKRRAIGEAVHSLAPAPTMRRRLSPSTMRRPPHRNRRSLPSAPRRRSVAVLRPEMRAACDSVKDSAPTMGGGAFSRSFGINHPLSRDGRGHARRARRSHRGAHQSAGGSRRREIQRPALSRPESISIRSAAFRAGARRFRREAMAATEAGHVRARHAFSPAIASSAPFVAEGSSRQGSRPSLSR